jgi:hypothetical protein
MPAGRPTFPSDPHPRRLGVGGGPGGGDKLVRAQLVIALVLGFSVLAVVLYLWRRPSGTEHRHDAAADPSASAVPVVPGPIVRTRLEEPQKPAARVKLGTVQRVKCGATPRLTAPDNGLCDALPFFEQALSKAVEDGVDCAPKSKEDGSISYVLIVDFRNRELRMYPGKSGTFHGPQAKKAVECVKKTLPAPTWDTMAHQYRYYMLSLLASYPGVVANEDGPDFK